MKNPIEIIHISRDGDYVVRIYRNQGSHSISYKPHHLSLARIKKLLNKHFDLHFLGLGYLEYKRKGY